MTAPDARETPDAGAPPRGAGVTAFVRRHPRALTIAALVTAFSLLGAGAVAAGVAVGQPAATAAEPDAEPAPVETSAEPTPEPEPTRAGPTVATAPTRVRTCSIAGLASDGRLGDFVGAVVNAETGEVLFDRAASTPARHGSVLKVLTAAAALRVLGPGYQLSTRVEQGSEPGQVVLVGGGDATLSALAPGQESVYRGAPKLADLAAQTVAAYAAANPEAPEITQVLLDATYWSPADKWDSSWERSEQTIGYHSEVTALQIDGDRQNPGLDTSPRSTDPITRAGEAFALALGAAGNPAGRPAVSTGVASGGAELAVVRSQPVSRLIEKMLMNSDNTLAEMLARVVSKESGFDGSAASLTQAFAAALQPYGVTLDPAMVIRDGSGLSHLNAVSPLYYARLFDVVAAGGGDLPVLTAGLPVAGRSGSLASRFGGDAAMARGSVAAKTGWINTAYSLSGIITAADGTTLTFAFSAIGNVQGSARQALDLLTAGAYRCGDNLTNT
ncbi:MAG: D-alanyl-D-alanine carboxypeptidase [Microcella sp.]|uniref:D-alanyl-D-alanine carboxypeptidase/D-alanyl-D-alanine-endopeptidase n=1 Tax=Microcella sp. TaxID=1913979 RepID=UPI002720FF29|nr:D-alanyl-D-alanine carboxypeptidase [Microcella sp.]MDO8337588.1 D-alanyl-D-alanine carboxypeptidase [Microcella sp.]